MSVNLKELPRYRVDSRATSLCHDDLVVIARHVGKILFTMGFEDIKHDDSMQNTPMRVAKYLAEYCIPIDLDDIFGSTFSVEPGFHEIVAQVNIPFRMVCEHHLLPALGKASIGYIPNKRVIGLSKMVRLVTSVGHERPSLQERIGQRICDLMEEHLQPQGVALVIQAEHGCVACRGTKSPGVITITSHVRGAFRDNHAAREEFHSLIRMEKS